tara:strand:+ start:3408 stop:4463 length:1056 start_codon:yes stop_codon:yes gene_type:complete
MKVFCYFVEPASYTLDLANNIYDDLNIEYCFINSKTLALSSKKPKKKSLDKMSLFSRTAFILSQYRKNDFIIVNGYNNYPFILTFLLNLFSFKKRFIATDSDTQFRIPTSFLKRFIKWIYLSIIFKNKYVLGFAGGSNSHKDLFRNYGMNEERIFLMPLMVNNMRFYKDFKQFPKIFTFLYVGRLVKHKNVESLIQQFNINFIDKPAVLRIVGSGDRAEYLENKYASDKVIFTGKKFNIDLEKEFKNASCFVCPSEFEPWGLVVNEALSSSLPVIATNEVGASFDLIKDKNTGFVVNNMNDFGNRMIELYNNSALLLEYSKNACELMKNHWNYNFYHKCLIAVIEKIKECR